MKKVVTIVLMLSIFLAFCGMIWKRVITNANPRKVALITDIGDIDDGGFNQASWEAIQKYCNKRKISYEYYRPSSDTNIAIHEQIRVAVKNGAEIIVCPGFKFSEVVAEAQKKFKNVHFVLLDAETTSEVCDNTVCIQYEMEISGFLAGYTVAQDLMKYDLEKQRAIKPNYGYGYIGGMANAGVYPFGFGFISGVINGTNDFVKKHNCKRPFITINYNYAGVFSQDDNAVSRVKGWYMGDGRNKIDVVFVCGGKLYQSIVEAAKYCNKMRDFNLDSDKDLRNAARWIGVDADQYLALKEEEEKKICYTSALKNIGVSIETVFDYHFSGRWDYIGGPYSDNKKAWVAGLGFFLGRKGNDDKLNQLKNYVGIPVITQNSKESADENERILRCFFNFKIGEYKEVEDLIIKGQYKIFNGFNSFGGYNGDADKNRGNPKFMNKNKEFSDAFFGGYDIDKYHIALYE
ncbi:MAG: BMP family ABC transporter substrate-binding protein [Bacilli bacterium]|nr:BMP family ABC transporter substrate-binding protein [Bacilli bacterium]